MPTAPLPPAPERLEADPAAPVARSMCLDLDAPRSRAGLPVRLADLRSICSEVVISPSGDALYLSVHRELQNFTHLYDLKYYDLSQRRLVTLADVGADSSYFSAVIGDDWFRTASVVHHETHHVRCFRRAERIPLRNGEQIVESLHPAMNGKLLVKNGDRVVCTAPDGIVGALDLGRDFYSVYWAHPHRNVLLLGYKRYDPAKGEVDYEYPATYFLVEVDAAFVIRRREKVLVERADERYGQFTPGRANEILFVKNIDTNGDGIADYRDRRNGFVMRLDLESLEVSAVLPEPMEIRSLMGHPEGLVFFADEQVEDVRSDVIVFDRRTGRKHVLLELRGGCFRDFTLSRDWTRLCYKCVLDTTGRGTHYDWEDESDIYIVDLAAASG